MTAEERFELKHPERVCMNPDCGKKFRARIPKQKYCCNQCSKADAARIQRELRAKEREEAEAFMRREEKTKVSLSFEQMAKLQKKHNLSYGKIEDAIRNGRIKVEEC
jgi:hypothetical protein